MTGKAGAQPAPFDLRPDAPFSFRCNACSRCCHHKIIFVTPYEVVRLSRALNLATTEFIARHTRFGGTALETRVEDDDACVFLGSEGCTVHADRPLVCRIYPLAIEVSADGDVAFARLEPHPETEGDFGVDGTASGYAAAQGVPEMRTGMEPYRLLYDRIARALATLDAGQLARTSELKSALMDMEAGETASLLIDADAMISPYCARHGLPLPASVDDTVAMHIAAIDEMIGSMMQGDSKVR